MLRFKKEELPWGYDDQFFRKELYSDSVWFAFTGKRSILGERKADNFCKKKIPASWF